MDTGEMMDRIAKMAAMLFQCEGAAASWFRDERYSTTMREAVHTLTLRFADGDGNPYPRAELAASISVPRPDRGPRPVPSYAEMVEALHGVALEMLANVQRLATEMTGGAK
jgi:hypothetical protein